CATPRATWSASNRARGGPIELEHLGSADPPLGLRRLYRGLHLRHDRGAGGARARRVGVSPAPAAARPAPDHRALPLRAPLCPQVAQSRRNERWRTRASDERTMSPTTMTRDTA